MVSSSTVNNHLPCAGHSTTYLPETSREDGDVATVARVVVLPVVSVRSSHPSSICQRENTLRRARRGTSRRSATRGGRRTAGRLRLRDRRHGNAVVNLISGNGGTTRWQTGLHTILLLARRTMLSTPSTSFHDLVPPSGRKSIEEEVPAVNAGARRHGAGVATGRRKGLSATR
uniref:Uncharacterized protein n=1 Tax=Oryza glumipatula TaxID=40148 RepID=A0A0E0B1W1_9ORYZ